MGALPGLPDRGGTSDRDETLLCVVRGRSGVTLWRLATRGDPSPTSLGRLPAGLDELWDIGADGRIAAAARDGNTLAVVDAGLGRGTRITFGDGVQLQGAQRAYTSYAIDVAVASDVVAILFVREGKSEVTFYRVK
jgi:hypothetical protein